MYKLRKRAATGGGETGRPRITYSAPQSISMPELNTNMHHPHSTAAFVFWSLHPLDIVAGYGRGLSLSFMMCAIISKHVLFPYRTIYYYYILCIRSYRNRHIRKEFVQLLAIRGVGEKKSPLFPIFLMYNFRGKYVWHTQRRTDMCRRCLAILLGGRNKITAPGCHKKPDQNVFLAFGKENRRRRVLGISLISLYGSTIPFPAFPDSIVVNVCALVMD